jgi:hypothetical protein
MIISAFDLIGDNSFLWHVRAGTVQIRATEVLTADPFSFTEFGGAWITQSWLVELGYGWMESMVGIGFVGPMMLLAASLTMMGIGLIAHRRSHSVETTAMVVLLSTVLLLMFLVPRPALFSYPLFVAVILAWDQPRSRWTVPLLFWLWASMHGSFAIGLFYLALSVVASRDWRGFRVVLVSAVATLLTAHGWGVVSMLWGFAQAREYLALISEWMTPDLLSPGLLPLVVGILILILGGMRGNLGPRSFWIIAPFLVLSFSAERAVATAWIALLPLLAVSLKGWTVSYFQGFSPRVGLAALAVIIAIPFAFVESVELDETRFPVAAAASLQDLPTFSDDFAGGYLIWRFGPHRKVFIDDRAELYGERILEFVEVRAGREPWQPVFARDGIEQALLKVDEPMIMWLEADGWVATYEDETYVVLRPPA